MVEGAREGVREAVEGTRRGYAEATRVREGRGAHTSIGYQ